MGKPLLQVIGPRLLVMVVCLVVSGILAYFYEQVPLTGTSQFVVIVAFYVSLCVWPCLLVNP
jgi:hypothetical protein